MKKSEIVKKAFEFDNIISHNVKKENKYYVIFSLPNKYSYARFGIAVGTKIGNAVTRNKYKRKLRSILDQNKFMFPKSYDYIIILKKACMRLSYLELQKELTNLLPEEK
ncbi:MAG TPA: ribonuclease P protein component [Bacilli bacterium]|nr:ribonuclease P protein component [Bacilli bacterium]